MRFRIERVFLTDETGRTRLPGLETTWQTLDAPSIDDALAAYVSQEGAEIFGEVLSFEGPQIVATLRAGVRVFTAVIDPALRPLRRPASAPAAPGLEQRGIAVR